MGLETSQEMIDLFPLAERDVAALFTLPKTIYGRQPLIIEMSYIIQHTVTTFRSRSKKEISHNSGSTVPTITSASESFHYQSVSDSASVSETGMDNPELSGSCSGVKSTTSHSFCSGSDRSSGTARIHGLKLGVVLVCLSGPGGVGKSTLFNSIQTVARKEG